MKGILIKDIKPGDLLFNDGKNKFMPNSITKAQRLIYGNILESNLSHIGMFETDKRIGLTVMEQDYPGKTQESSFIDEYVNTNEDVYVGRLINVHSNIIDNVLKDLKRLADDDVFSNYSYKSLIGLLHQAIYYKVSKRFPNKFLTGIPEKRYTCNQVLVKLLEMHGYDLKLPIEWYRTYPATVALSENVKLYKLIK